MRKVGGEEATFVVPEDSPSNNYNIFLNLEVGGDLNIGLEGNESTCSKNSTSKGKETLKESDPVVALPLNEKGILKRPKEEESEPVVALAVHGAFDAVSTLPIDKRAVLPLPSVPGRGKEAFFQRGAVGAVDGGTAPLSCGGGRGTRDSTTNKCFKYDPKSRAWKLSGLMMVERRNTGYSVHPDLGLVITAGDGNRGKTHASAEATQDGKHFKALPSLPVKMAHHCQVTLDDNSIVVSGGLASRKNINTVLLLDIAERKWKPLPGLKTARHGHGCGVLRVAGQPRKLFIAGGSSTRTENGVEVLDLDTLKWTAGTQTTT